MLLPCHLPGEVASQRLGALANREVCCSGVAMPEEFGSQGVSPKISALIISHLWRGEGREGAPKRLSAAPISLGPNSAFGTLRAKDCVLSGHQLPELQ